VVIETGVVVGYLIAWAARKAARAAGRVNAIVDELIDTGLDKLHDAVTTSLGADPALAELERQAGGGDQAQVTARTRTRVELALEDAFERDAGLARTLAELVTDLRSAEQRSDTQTAMGTGAVNLIGNVDICAEHGSAAAMTMGNVSVGPATQDPHKPGRPRD
jgi:hypothetical protein